jgi:hypothetical protein
MEQHSQYYGVDYALCEAADLAHGHTVPRTRRNSFVKNRAMRRNVNGDASEGIMRVMDRR